MIPKDTINLQNCHFLCHIGVTAAERAERQDIFLDIKVFVDIKPAAASDQLEDTVNYVLLHEAVKILVEAREYRLIETMAEEVASLALRQFDVDHVTVKVRKPNALKERGVKWVDVEITRTRI